jgi:phosphoenolpyruvate carboxylase
MADASPDNSPHRTDEPYRRALISVYARLAATARKLGIAIQRKEVGVLEPYAHSEEFSQDLDIIAASLTANHGTALIRKRLHALQRAVQIFGFHLATLDMRQSSDMHEQVLSELFKAANVIKDYASLSEEEKNFFTSKSATTATSTLLTLHKLFRSHTIRINYLANGAQHT